jgi:predicted RNase H-like HicB family nuclease
MSTDVRSRLYTDYMTQRFRVALFRSEEGVAVSVPGLPGCWSQGSDEDEALENIKDAIHDYLSVANEQLEGAEIREIEVAI